ncbi:hypothetical protein [Sorangium sp. So ce542]|uniref:hypothetical protein n=1 Tax=Sorangium sp. So ce542 TaxID=3133316 RepID=UPI003F5FA604
MDIQLFLANADDHQPALADGLPERSAYGAPRPELAPPESDELENLSGPADALPQQRWAVIAPRGPEGDRLLRLIEPLKRRREEQQGAEAVVYRVDPGMRFGAASAWLRTDYWNAVGRRVEDLPRYVLVLGDADLVSWDLQQMLGGAAFAGRLAFADEGGYEAYVQKVLQSEAEAPAPGASALFYAVRDGTRATTEGYQHLMGPTLEGARRGGFPAQEIREIGGGGGMLTARELEEGAQEMLRAAAQARAGLLFSLSHGAGAPRGGWGSPAEQRAGQGALVLGHSGAHLGARDVGARPFLPGGLWLMFACFGAGTPARSAYYPWLDRLARMGRTRPAERVLASLPSGGAPPFVAALPQAALANPAGPLGVVGHVDLAWTWGFVDHDEASPGVTARRRAERFQGMLRSLLEGHRLGVAHHELARFFCGLSVELAMMYHEDADPLTAPRGDDAREARRAGLWMQQQDLSAYVLLGDPAARMPIARWPEGTLATAAAAAAPPALASGTASILGMDVALPAQGAAARDPQRMEQAVVAVIGGGDARAVAARHGVEEAELRRWASAYVDAGRAALRRLA